MTIFSFPVHCIEFSFAINVNLDKKKYGIFKRATMFASFTEPTHYRTCIVEILYRISFSLSYTHSLPLQQIASMIIAFIRCQYQFIITINLKVECFFLSLSLFPSVWKKSVLNQQTNPTEKCWRINLALCSVSWARGLASSI